MTELPLRVNAFLFKKDDKETKFLCVRRVPQDGGFWQTVTGTVSDEESLIQTITREIKEECGIASDKIIKITGPVYEFEWIKKDKNIKEFVYLVEVDSNVLVILNKDEHNDFAWCTGSELVEKLEKEDNKKAASKVFEYLKSV